MIRSFKPDRLLAEKGPQRSIQLGLAALAVIDLLFYLFGVGPLGESDRERRLQVQNMRKQVELRQTQVARLAGNVEKVENARAEGDKLLKSVAQPRRTAYSTIVSELDQAGKQAAVELRDRSLSIEPIEGSDTLSIMTVTATLEGSYENLVKFLNLLDRSPRFLIIGYVAAAPQQAGPQQTSDRLGVTLKLDSFVRGES